MDGGYGQSIGATRAAEKPLDAFCARRILHVQDAMERVEVDHAKADQVRIARDATTMFDELKALADWHAELHADLERARRPWWSRLWDVR
jgi:hypothetical protein